MKLLSFSLCVASAIIFVGCSGSQEPTDTLSLANCYAEEFGSKPPPGVSNLRAKQIVVGDAASAWLRFEADPNLVEQLIITKGFSPSDQVTFGYMSGGGANTPEWWKPKQDAVTRFYINAKWRKTDSFSQAFLAHDETSHVVYFYHGMSF